MDSGVEQDVQAPVLGIPVVRTAGRIGAVIDVIAGAAEFVEDAQRILRDQVGPPAMPYLP